MSEVPLETKRRAFVLFAQKKWNEYAKMLDGGSREEISRIFETEVLDDYSEYIEELRLKPRFLEGGTFGGFLVDVRKSGHIYQDEFGNRIVELSMGCFFGNHPTWGFSKDFRYSLAKKQRFRCAICHGRVRITRDPKSQFAKTLLPSHVDHIVPISKGGTNAPSNLRVLCRACNLKKGKRLQDNKNENKEENKNGKPSE